MQSEVITKMNFRGYDWREKRNILNQGMPFSPMHYTIANYSTDCLTKKPEAGFDEDLLNRFQSIPDPLKKNLADTVITSEEKNKEKVQKMPPETQCYYESCMNAEKTESTNRSDFYQSLTGITTFFSNVFGAISGAMFQKRAKSPVSQYYDCFDLDSEDCHKMSLDSWPKSKFDDQNKNGAPEQFSTVSNDNMNNCRATVAHCENKLNAVRSLLTNKTAPNPPRYRSRRPRKVFVEPGSVEECFEDTVSPQDFVSFPNGEYIEYVSVQNNHSQEFCEIDAPKMKTEVGPVKENTEIVKVIPEIAEKIEVLNSGIVNNSVEITENSGVINNSVGITEKQEVILSCEDKMAKLKSLLQEKRKKNTRTSLNTVDSASELIVDQTVSERPKKPTKTVPIDRKQDKRFKNPNRCTDKRKHMELRKNIQEDLLFAHEIDSEEVSSTDNSPLCISALKRLSEPLPIQPVGQKDYFDELKGRFYSSSTTESEDSFQIVFSDSPKLSRMRKPSECDSEDSFIVFEDSPDSCYTSNDIFGDHPTSDSEAEYSGSESDISDSGCGIPDIRLSHNLSRTISDLTDDSLYVDEKNGGEGDVVDCAFRKDLDEIPLQDVQDNQEIVEESVVSEETGLPSALLTDAKKLSRKDQPPKKVSFSTAPPKVHVMRVWAFAARQARAGHWERLVVDRDRFKRRIADVDMAVSWVLKPQHRKRVMFQRFMPWWNAQRRKEIAEKKEMEAAEKIQREEEERAAVEASKLEEERGSVEFPDSISVGDINTVSDNTVEELKINPVIKKINSKLNSKDAKSKDTKIKNGIKSKKIIAVNNKLADLNKGFAVKEEVSGT